MADVRCAGARIVQMVWEDLRPRAILTPGAFDMINRAKYDAWAKLKGTAGEKAKQDYVKLVERLKKTYG